MYNDRDQLVSETQQGGPVHTYHYDANGAQTLKAGDGPDQLFGWDLRERVGNDPSATTLDRSYLNGRQIEGQADANGFGDFMRDAHGSNRGLLKRSALAAATTAPATMAAWERYDFQAFGEPVKLWSADVGTGGGDFASPGDARTTHLHAGDGEYAASVGLYYNDARFRDRFRFVSRDPTIFGPGQTLDANLYRYAGGDPVHGIDPLGTFTLVEALKATGIALVIVALIGVPSLYLYRAFGGPTLRFMWGGRAIDMNADGRFNEAFAYMKQYSEVSGHRAYGDAARRMMDLINESSPLVLGNPSYDDRGATDQTPSVPRQIRKTVISTHPSLNSADLAMLLFGEDQRREGDLGDDFRVLNVDVTNFQNWLNRNAQPPPTKQWDHPR